ncbi:hypothetical protein [Acinetobacter lanii]|uniref:hypothetical protein n=1 Tax=Acinetobacter lanii TaxID=2715163 RepID=UPI001490272B|nr:hypothetical protein [Acinetobacter lanii]
MIEFKSLIKINENYVDINNCTFSHLVKSIDWDYVEGKIIIFYYGKEIFGSEIVDDINWFWGFVADGFNEFFENGVYDIGFPSQDIRFVLVKIKKNIINLKITSEDVVYLDKEFNSTELLSSLLNSAINYFDFEKRFNKDEKIEMNRKIGLIESYKKNI